ncbi:MAG TPA: hypothetical protein VFB80_10430 [Pirellulaceae bacterium]|nr:hypothetical protein [Pirellulaceae bacterium]
MDEQLKQQLMPAIVVFNLTVIAWVLYRFFTAQRGMFFQDFVIQALIGAAIGLATGGVTLLVTMRKK